MIAAEARAARATTRAKTGLVALENTHNMAGGTVTPPEMFDDDLRRGARRRTAGAPGRRAHLQCRGRSRRFRWRKLTAKADTVMFCLSKGLGAPVGSMLVGTRGADRPRHASIAKRWAEACGRPGMLAAAGLIALEQGPRQAGRRSRQREVSGRRAGAAFPASRSIRRRCRPTS